MNRYIVKDRQAVILDLGCGNGTQTILAAGNFGRVVGIDPDENAIGKANRKVECFGLHQRVKLFPNRIGDMHFNEDYFDGVLSYCVLEHIPEYETVLKEVRRVLKPGGWFICSVDSLSGISDQGLLDRHRKDHHVVQYFTDKSIVALFEKMGFQNIIVKPILKSRYAQKMFTKGILNKFNFSRVTGLVTAILLFLFERLGSENNEGLFLVVKAEKGSN